MIANSPAFRSGKNPLGECAMKYATAMSPARMNATGRVNKPSTINTPPISSIMPLMPESEMGATPVEGDTGRLKYFDVPCSRNSRPTMMRKILSTRGDHVASHHNFSHERLEALPNPRQTPHAWDNIFYNLACGAQGTYRENRQLTVKGEAEEAARRNGRNGCRAETGS